MIIVDTALKKRLAAGNPVKVGMVGAGYMGARHRAPDPHRDARPAPRRDREPRRRRRPSAPTARPGSTSARSVASTAELESAMAAGRLRRHRRPDGAVPGGRRRGGHRDDRRRRVRRARRARRDEPRQAPHPDERRRPTPRSARCSRSTPTANGVVYTYTDGDEPGVAMNLFRFVDSIGYKPVLLGQIKGFLDRYRNPDTQRDFAEKHGQKPGDGRLVRRRLEARARVARSSATRRASCRACAACTATRCAHVKDLLNALHAATTSRTAASSTSCSAPSRTPAPS